jgi:hypothetical protein
MALIGCFTGLPKGLQHFLGMGAAAIAHALKGKLRSPF